MSWMVDNWHFHLEVSTYSGSSSPGNRVVELAVHGALVQLQFGRLIKIFPLKNLIGLFFWDSPTWTINGPRS